VKSTADQLTDVILPSRSQPAAQEYLGAPASAKRQRFVDVAISSR
jgi:hypothetical protein